ncbi:hypothetical protein JOD45_000252 [Scopulibacillus daqui]|uniref:Uncharacterized protein n=1 Tax=Scopulibacillus daqui TaxID=1469162 RepID=A0ABS2PW04_9BACL|nr:hypothetical protein [Scopulibacillus daqui]MBM7644061.1 hypothetical protein [Scopulibacillus daqui]
MTNTNKGTKIIIEGESFPIDIDNYNDEVGKDDQFKLSDKDSNKYIIKNEDPSFKSTSQYKRVRIYGTYEGKEKEVLNDQDKKLGLTPENVPTITAYKIENKPRTAEEIAEDEAREERIQKEYEENSFKDEISESVHKGFGNKNSFNKKDSIIEINYNDNNNFLLIKVFGKDNLSKNMIKKGMWMSISKTLKDLKDNTKFDKIAFNIVFPMQDQYGNASNNIVMKATFDRDTLDKINWENFMFENIPNVANEYWEHPSF